MWLSCTHASPKNSKTHDCASSLYGHVYFPNSKCLLIFNTWELLMPKDTRVCYPFHMSMYHTSTDFIFSEYCKFSYQHTIPMQQQWYYGLIGVWTASHDCTHTKSHRHNTTSIVKRQKMKLTLDISSLTWIKMIWFEFIIWIYDLDFVVQIYDSLRKRYHLI